MRRIQTAIRIALAAALLAGSPAGAAPPQVMTYSGYLKNSSGGPVVAATNITFRLYTAQTGGTPVWSETVSVTPSGDGWFSAVIGTTSSLPFTILNQDLYLSLQVGADPEFTVRARVTPSHAALTVDWGGVQGKPFCTAGAYLSLDNGGGLTCSIPPTGTGGITSVSGSRGITATTTGSSVSLTLPLCATIGDVMRWDGTAWGCSPGSGGFTPPSCTTGQIMQWSGTAWQCAADATGLASVAVSTPLTGNGTSAQPLGIGVASGTSSGYLTAADYNAFAGKAPAPGASCLPNQVLTWSAGAFQCVADMNSGGTVTSVTAAPGPIVVGGTAIIPAIGITQADAAGTAGYVTSADYVAWSGKQSRVTGTCAANQKLLAVNADGTVTCGTDADTNTTYSAGTGLTLSGTTFGANLVASGGRAGTAATLARSDHSHATVVPVTMNSFVTQNGTPTYATVQYGSAIPLPGWTLHTGTSYGDCISAGIIIPPGASALPTLVVNVRAAAGGTLRIDADALGVVSGAALPTNSVSGAISATITTTAGTMYRASGTATSLANLGGSPSVTAGPGDTVLFRVCNAGITGTNVDFTLTGAQWTFN